MGTRATANKPLKVRARGLVEMQVFGLRSSARKVHLATLLEERALLVNSDVLCNRKLPSTLGSSRTLNLGKGYKNVESTLLALHAR